MPELKQGGKFDYGLGKEGKEYVAGSICPLIYGHSDWDVREIVDNEVESYPFYTWRGDDLSTGKPYDVTVRPWYRHAVERGEGFTEPYADPATGEVIRSYVAPLCRADGAILGVVIAGSFLDQRGNAY